MRIALEDEVQTLDPQAQNESVSWSVLGNIFEGLVAFDRNMKIIPSLAESWENPDEFTWRFRLRKGVRFHNGKEFKAEDVVYTLRRAKTYSASKIKSYLIALDSLKVLDDWTVELITKRSYPVLLNKLTFVFVLPAPGVSKDKEDESIAQPIGTGPYCFIEWKKGQVVKLVANENYWNSKPTISEVWFMAIPDDYQRVQALLNGSVDLIREAEESEVTRLRQTKGIKVICKPGLSVTYLGFNVKKLPFKNKRIRQAVSLALDREDIITRHIFGEALLAGGPLSQNVFGFNPKWSNPIKKNFERANQLLESAGFPKGFSVTLDVVHTAKDIAETIKEQLRKLKIEIKIKLWDWTELYPRLCRGESDFFLTGWGCSSGDASDLFDDCVHTADTKRGYGEANHGGYSNQKLDKLIEESSTILDSSLRLEKLQQIVDLFMEELPLIPLYMRNNIYAFSERPRPLGQNKIIWEPRQDRRVYAAEIGVKQ